MWKSSTDLLATIRDAHDRLVAGTTPVDQAHAEARILGTAAKVIALQLDHARMTGRLTQGDATLPAFEIAEQSVGAP